MSESTEAALLTQRGRPSALDVTECVRQLAREGHLEATRTAIDFRVYDRASVEEYLRSRK